MPSLERLYITDLSDKHMAAFITSQMPCFFNIALFGRNTLKLPLKSLSLGYKLEKVRIVFELRDSSCEKHQGPGLHWMYIGSGVRHRL